ncbi:hypothetical protein [Aeromonas hydrophila]|uniref:hypothetical protein n=1 Tax=Aeromonas hydrophila TaxID=644 RepID=UPI002B4A41F1|nr:hypothetical protein [Aeromonas hydrophila]
MSAFKKVFFILYIFALAGCTNLKDVRDYASESAKLSAYTELTTRFRDTYTREQFYIPDRPDILTQAQANDKRRKAAYEDLLKIHYSVSLYMKTLAVLAGDDTFDLSKNIDSLAGSIQAHPEFGINEGHVDAIFKISKIITKEITHVYQESAVRNMIKEGDAPLQTTLNGMLDLVRLYKKTNYNEKKMVLGFFETNTSKDKLVSALARVHIHSLKAGYDDAELKYDDAEKGIKSIAEGHKKLFDNVNKLSNDEVIVFVKKIAQDIKDIRENLQAVHE